MGYIKGQKSQKNRLEAIFITQKSFSRTFCKQEDTGSSRSKDSVIYRRLRQSQVITIQS